MERLECSQATLYRLVAELRNFLGAPLEQDADNRGFYYDRSYDQPFELPGIWISPAEQWHPDQKGSYDDQGAWTLELPFSTARELVMDILRYGSEVKVLSPDFLRDAVAESARQTTAIYD